jgi:septation ring formation regulator EzrA
MEYVIAIDKSKKLHLEFEGTEAHHLTENLEAFVDDVVTGKIDRKKLREIPHKVENLKEELGNEIDTIEERLNKSIQHIEDTQKLLHQNQSDISENLVTCMEIVRKIGEASESVARTAHTIMKEVEFLTAETREEFGKCSYLSHCS